jgi:hypothetical protein
LLHREVFGLAGLMELLCNRGHDLHLLMVFAVQWQ